MQPGRDVVPREDLVVGAMAGDVPVGIEPLGRHRLGPAVELEALAPLLEDAAVAPHPLDHAADAAVAPAGDALGEGGLGIVPAQRGTALAQVVAQQEHLAAQLVGAVLAEPLERRVRLGYEPAQ